MKLPDGAFLFPLLLSDTPRYQQVSRFLLWEFFKPKLPGGLRILRVKDSWDQSVRSPAPPAAVTGTLNSFSV